VEVGFLHSIKQKSRGLMKKLGTDTISWGSTTKSISPNQIASRMLRIKTQMNREDVRRMKRKLQRIKKSLKPNPSLSSSFTLDELELTLSAMKPSKAADFHDIYPECIKDFGRANKTWIITFVNDGTYLQLQTCRNLSNEQKSSQFLPRVPR
jgi:hypothetical protein